MDLTTTTPTGGNQTPVADASAASNDELVAMVNYMDPALLPKKRERTTNWVTEEKRALLEMVRARALVVENKRLDGDLTVLKNKVWRRIHRQFTRQFGGERSTNRLKEQWRRMKANARADIATYHKQLAAYGPALAAKRKPAQLVIDIYEFILDAKRLCATDAGVDYASMMNQLPADSDSDGEDGNK